MKRMIAGFMMIGAAALFAGCGKGPAAGTVAESGKAAPAASRVAELTDATFAEQTATGVVLVDFWAPWCGPCRIQGPLVDKAAEQLGGVAKVAKLNVDVAGKTAEKFGVQSIPTLIVFKDGKPVKQFVGVTQPGELVAAVKAAQGTK